MKSYPAYKPSGLDWLPQIPEHWETKKAKRLFGQISEKNHPLEPLLSATQDRGVVPREQSENRVVMPMGELTGFKLVRRGEFVISLRSFEGGIEFSDYQGLVSPAYTVMKLRHAQEPRYLRWLFKSHSYIQVLNTVVSGIRQGKNIGFDDFAEIALPLPSPDEQAAIVAFIESKAGEIEHFVQLKQRTVALLREQKTALINRAVTQGLNPHAPRRASGLDWLGDIPAHWEVKKLKYFADYITRGNSPDYAENSNIKVINQACVYPDGLRFENVKYQKEGDISDWKGVLQPGDVLVNSTGTGTLGRIGLFNNYKEKYLADGHVTIIRDSKSSFNSPFLAYMLSTRQDWITAEASEGATNQIELQRDEFRSLKLPFPPLSEQATIVEYIERETQLIEATIERTEREIELVQELKTSLIAAAVTGQIDVRDLMAAG